MKNLISPNERRWKALRVSEDVLRDSLLMPGEVPRCRVEGIPEGCAVERVFYEFMTASFLFVLSHPSFEPVPEAYKIPEFDPLAVTFTRLPGPGRRGREFV